MMLRSPVASLLTFCEACEACEASLSPPTIRIGRANSWLWPDFICFDAVIAALVHHPAGNWRPRCRGQRTPRRLGPREEKSEYLLHAAV